MAAAVFAVGAAWQLCAVVRGVLELASRAPVARPPIAPGVATLAQPVAPRAGEAVSRSTLGPLRAGDAATRVAAASLVSLGVAGRRVAPGAAFESSAEAPERVVPLGLAAIWKDIEEPLGIGREPPQNYPRRDDCTDIFVYIVTAAEGFPKRSAASLGVGKTGPARFRRPGERIGDWTLVAISEDWSGLEPGVWLEKDGAVCSAVLAGNPARVHAPLEPRARPAPPRPRRRGRR